VTASKTGARKTRAPVARSGNNGKPHAIKLTHAFLRDLELTGPPELPPTFSWDYAELQSLARDEDEGVMGTLYDLIVSVVGKEQARLIRNRIKEKAPTTTDAGTDLMGSILGDLVESYGTTEGES
jgi:hypothetical protein